MEAPFKCKDSKQIHIEPIVTDPFARERELMQAAIEEVLEGEYKDDYTVRETTSSIDLGNFLEKITNGKKPQVIEDTNNPRGFVNSAVSHFELGTSISLQRHDMASRYFEPSFVDNRFREDPLHLVGEAFAEPSLDELAEMGVFEGQHGRKIFDNIVSRDQQNEIRRTDEIPLELSDRLIEIPLPQLPDIEFPLEITPQLDTLPPPVEKPPVAEQSAVADQSSVVPAVENSSTQSIQSQTTISDQNYVLRMVRIAKTPSIHEEDQLAQVNEQKPARKPRVPRPKKVIGSEPVVNFIKLMPIKPKKPFKPHKNPNRVESSIKNIDIDMWSLLDNLPEYNVPEEQDVEELLNMSKAVQQVDIVEPQGISKVPQIPQEIAEVQQIPQEIQQEISLVIPQIPQEFSLEIPHIEQQLQLPQDTSLVIPQIDLPHDESSFPKRAIVSPELDNVSKRRRLALQLETSLEIPQIEPSLHHQSVTPMEINELPEIETALPEMLIQIQPQQNLTDIDMIIRDAPQRSISVINEPERMLTIPSMSTPSGSLFKTPLSMAQPQKQTSEILAGFETFRKKLNLKNVDESRAVTPQDIIYGQLRNKSKEASIQPPTIPDMQLEPMPNLEFPTLSEEPEEYREMKKNGIEYVQFKNKQGKIAQYEEYNVQNMLLYLQVRKYMKMNAASKINVPNLLQENVLKVKNVNSNRILEIRLMKLCNYGLFKGEWSDDDMNLIEIELPHEVTLTEEQDKENIP